MRVLFVNKFHYFRGGDCTYTINLARLLESQGHEVAFFAMNHPENIETEFSRFFLSEISFSPKGNKNILESLRRPFGSSETRRKFSALLDEFRPDIVHLNNIHTQISPLVALMAKERGIRVVWTLHDYKLICPSYSCLDEKMQNCERCYGGDVINCYRHRCLKGSRIGSLIAYLEARKWSHKILQDNTDSFVCPSHFMKRQMMKAGFDENKLIALCNFIDTEKCSLECYEKEEYFCYIGRLDKIKGVDTLVRATLQSDRHLVIIGDGPERENIQKIINGNPERKNQIELVGYKQWPEIKQIVAKARFSVIPSQWYENNPLGVIESLALGTPVLGAEIGGIPELICSSENQDQPRSGMLFESGNQQQLTARINEMAEASFNYKAIAEYALKEFSAAKYAQEITRIYQR